MGGPFKELNRRDFLKLGGVTATGYALFPFIEPLLIDRDLDFLYGVKYASPLPPELTGTWSNLPFIWELDAQAIRNYRGKGELQNVDIQRILSGGGNIDLEPYLGVFNEAGIDKMEGYIASVPQNETVVLSILNGFNIFRSDLKFYGFYIYPPQPVSSPYFGNACTAEPVEDVKEEFFEFEDGKENSKFTAYKNRADLFIDRFGKYKNVVFEIGNEIQSLAGGREGKRRNTVWYNKAINHIRRKYKGVLLTGVTDAEAIDYDGIENKENLVTTKNVYCPVPNLPFVKHATPYPQPVPVVIKEIGIPWKFLGKYDFNDADKYLKNFMLGTLQESIVDDTIYNGGVGVWQLDPEHNDFYNATKDRYPKTFYTMNNLSPVLKMVFTRPIKAH